MRNLRFILPLFLLAACTNNDQPKTKAGDDNTTPAPAPISFSINATYPHDTSFYTQGLVIYKGNMYEGTGLEGHSRLMKVDLKTGKVLQKIDLDPKYFGEGITILHDTIYQLTWQNKVVFMYSLKDFKKLKEFPIQTDGWGITTDGRELIVSDGSSNLYFYEPGTFRQLRTVAVTDAGQLVNNINELEFIDGNVYANKYQSNYILRIDPVTGVVNGKADLSNVGEQMTRNAPYVDVLNGIAYDSSTHKTYITGKLWPQLYEVQFSK